MSDQTFPALQLFRIFLASPGDVEDERGIARSVIDQVGSELAFRGRVSLKCIAWDQLGVEVAMEVTLTPQEAIAKGMEKPSECNLVVVIFWSRMGTPLPDSYKKPDGTTYLSGTEWEYLDAVAGTQRSGKRPSVWVYRKTEIPVVSFGDPQFLPKRRQWDKLEFFFQQLVNDDGSIKGGVNYYKSPEEFRRLFERHLRDHLTKEVFPVHMPESVPQEDTIPKTPLWTGIPYPGLESFKPEQAAIFFGRGAEVDQLIKILRDPEMRFIGVLGASGTGKSSLVSGGLIPRLRAGALPGSKFWIDITFKPAERGGDPFMAVAYQLKAVLGTTGERESDIARKLRTDPDDFSSRIVDLLGERPHTAEILVVVDQFEEIFSPACAGGRAAFIERMETLVATPRVRVIVTMRADFFAQAIDSPVLAALLQGKGTFPLAAPGVLALSEMIRRPALIAGLEIKDDLCEQILKDTGTGVGALALMAFAMHEVYERGRDCHRLILGDYLDLGGVEGAIKTQAENALIEQLHVIERDLHELFRDLVEVNEHGIATRRRLSIEAIPKGGTRERLVNALVDARILVADAESRDNPTVEVAHEAVFRAWDRLASWIEDHAAELRGCKRLVRASEEWQDRGAPRLAYLPDRATLKQYRMVPWDCVPVEVAGLVSSFLKTARRRQALWTCLLAFFVVVVGALGGHIWLRYKHANWNILRIWTLAKLSEHTGLPFYMGPQMEAVPAGEFMMGAIGDQCKDRAYSEECPRHQVTIKAFYMGKYEVTFDEFAAYLLDTNIKIRSNESWWSNSLPATNVSWDGVTEYCNWLKQVTGEEFRLPTEAEWEYACRAGTETEFYSGNEYTDLDRAGWYEENSSMEIRKVGQKDPNRFRLYDMHGNVSEWVQDRWHTNYEGAPNDGSAWLENPEGTGWLARGCAYGHYASACRSASRHHVPAEFVKHFGMVGFRLSRSAPVGN